MTADPVAANTATREVAPDWKRSRGREIRDPSAVRRATLRRRGCVACGEQGTNGHHVLARGNEGDDVDANIVTLCGSGTSGCHGAYHGSPYVATLVEVDPGSMRAIGASREERRDREWVARRIGKHLVADRSDTIDYVVAKLGVVAGRHYLASRYFLLDAELDEALASVSRI